MKINIWKYTISIHKRNNVIVLPEPIQEKSLIPISPKTHPLGIIAEEVFQVFLLTYLLLLLIETIKPDFVIYFFNLNILIGIVLVSGIFMTLFTSETSLPRVFPEPIHWKYIAIISIASALLVFYKTENLKGLSIILTILTGAIVFLLSYIISVDTQETPVH